MRSATEELNALAEKLQIPVAHSMCGIGGIDTTHPLSLGLVSRAGACRPTARRARPTCCWHWA